MYILAEITLRRGGDANDLRIERLVSGENAMNDLLDLVLRAHGGLDRWNKFNKVSATFVTGGGLLPMKGLETPPKPLDGTVTIHEESTVIRPFGQPDWRMIFTPNRV